MLYGASARSPSAVERLKSLGFDYGEIVLSGFGSMLRRVWWESGVKSPMPDGFFLVAHGPLVEDDPGDLGYLKRKYLPELIATVDAAVRMDIKLLTVHLSLDGRFLNGFVLGEKRRALKELVVYGNRQGVTICLENTSESAGDLVAAVEAVPELKLTLDIGHGQLYRPINTSFEIIRLLGTSIRHVHLHDNNGGDSTEGDLHLPPGKGSIDLRGICRDLVGSGYDRTLTLEVRPSQMEVSLCTIRELIGNVYREAFHRTSP